MFKKVFSYLLLVLSLCFFVNCMGNTKSAQQFNDYAVEIMMEAWENSGTNSSDSLFMVADSVLLEAIKIDPTLRCAYSNRVAIMFSLKRYDDAIKILEGQKPFGHLPEDYFMLGVAYEKIDDVESANRNYTIAIAEYDLKCPEELTIADVLNRGIAILMICDNADNRDKIITQLRQFSENEFAIQMIENFSRDALIDSISMNAN